MSPRRLSWNNKKCLGRFDAKSSGETLMHGEKGEGGVPIYKKHWKSL